MNAEQNLFLQLQYGEEKAYKELFLMYYSPLCEYASRYIRDEEAEELVQDLMLYLWEAREEIVIEASLKSYLFTAVKNRCLNAIKRNVCHEQAREQLSEKLKDQFDDPDYYLFNELSERIEKSVRELPDNYRETFEMSRFGMLSNAQIAQRLNISIKTIEYRISQSLKILRTKLKDYLLD
ncbi:MAG: RNA polymerase sigma-70 factor [Tannerellaceae bacterium]|jgi:RNA polymerase sigma-70 factor (ECF subfamily)|nr:RNA polymerase sigma-70 factor [Tannerellaceae bacterium]